MEGGNRWGIIVLGGAGNGVDPFSRLADPSTGIGGVTAVAGCFCWRTGVCVSVSGLYVGSKQVFYDDIDALRELSVRR